MKVLLPQNCERIAALCDSDNDTRPAINGVRVQTIGTDGYEIQATDTRAAIIVRCAGTEPEIPWATPAAQPASVIVPAELWNRAFGWRKENHNFGCGVEVAGSSGSVSLRIADVNDGSAGFSSQPIEAKWPNFDGVVPPSGPIRATIKVGPELLLRVAEVLHSLCPSHEDGGTITIEVRGPHDAITFRCVNRAYMPGGQEITIAMMPKSDNDE